MPTSTYQEPTILQPAYAASAGIVVYITIPGEMTRQQLEDIPVLQEAAQSIVFIPNDPANRDWQDYQAWLAAGNTPVPEHLADVKARKIGLLRNQLFPYVESSTMVSQGITWRTTMWGFHQHELVGSLTAADYLTGDGKAHMIDVNDVERVLDPTAARKTTAAAQAWLLTAYEEYLGVVDEVNACTTNAQVAAIVWTPKYSPSNPFNADAVIAGLSGFDTGFDKGYGY